MFCPQCKAEYRQGFTRCADCDVDLVWELPTDALVPHTPAPPGDPDEDPFCSFWKGDDPRLHTELCQLLDEQGIPHKTVRRADHLFNISKYPAFQIGIPFSLFDRAEAAVKEAYGTHEEPPDPANLLPYGEHGEWEPASPRTSRPWLPETKGFAWSSQGREAEAETEPESQAKSLPEEPASEAQNEPSSTHWDPENWNPEDASVEIWSGDSPELAEMLGSSLRENQIHYRGELAAGQHLIFVLPQDETRAREIIREIVEGTPPQ